MKRAFVFAVVAGFAAAPAAFADAAAGEGLYQQKCNMCHAQGLAGAPLFDVLTKLEPAQIKEALDHPKPMMAGAVAGISEGDKNHIIDFLTSKNAG